LFVLTHSVFPATLARTICKQSAPCFIISPLLKKLTLDKEELSDYQPISNLSLISKIIQRVVKSRLMDHLTSNSLLNSHQSAYCKHHFIETALFKDSEARNDGVSGCSGISWITCKQSASRSRQITTSTPHHSIFTGRMLFLTPKQQCQST